MLLNRRTTLSLLALAAIPFATGAFAGEKKAFTDAAFDAANKAGKPVFVEVAASWCPTCKQQAPHISKIIAEPRFKDLVVLSVDFDAQKDVLKKLNVQKQSTLLTFKGGKEIERSVGDTDPNTIKMLIESTL